VGHRPRRKYVVRTLVEVPAGDLLPAGPPPSYLSEKRYRRFLAALARRQPDLTVVVENVYDSFNLSAVLRTCDAVGIGTVHLLYYREKPPRILSGVASSAQKWLTLLRMHGSVEEAFTALRAAGLRVYATGEASGALSPAEVDFTQPTAILLGNENRGVSPEALALADGVIHIPMLGMVQSVNVTVAAGMILYEAQRQRAEAGFYDAPRLPEEEWRALLARWLKREMERG
jgi:tRNA (guanosine-2'-O-)-methyltransferase